MAATDSLTEELLLIDGNSLAYRAFFALPESIGTSDGRPTNAIFGLASMLVVLPASIAFGVLAYAALGPAYAATGVLAGIFGSRAKVSEVLSGKRSISVLMFMLRVVRDRPFVKSVRNAIWEEGAQCCWPL